MTYISVWWKLNLKWSFALEKGKIVQSIDQLADWFLFLKPYLALMRHTQALFDPVNAVAVSKCHRRPLGTELNEFSSRGYRLVP